MTNRVALVRCRNYSEDIVYRALEEAVELAGGLDVAGMRVLLKPNILFDAPPDRAITTHPAILHATIKLCQKMGAAKIYVGDSPGIHKSSFTGEISGLRQVTDSLGAEWVDFSRGTTELRSPSGRVARSFVVSDIVTQVDRIISLPKLKTHQLMYFTGAMKNLFGLVPGLMKSPYHLHHPSRSGFATMIVDLVTGLKPHYAIMDGIVGMEGPGPAGGTPRRLEVILASSNLLALDEMAARIIGYPHGKIPVAAEAFYRGEWLCAMTDIETLGDPVESFITRDYKKVPIKSGSSQLVEFAGGRTVQFLRSLIEPRPKILNKRCTRCGECTRICPASAMEFRGRGKKTRIVVDYSKCIRCYCCHEICKFDAIELKTLPPFF